MYIVRRRGNRSIERLQHEMEDTFHSLVVSGRTYKVRVSSGSAPAWRPPIEVYETADSLVVLAEIAGMTEDQIEVVMDDTVMTIRGERLPANRDERRTVHAMGIDYGPFAADIFLPFAVDEARISATYEAGLLRVELPRGEATRITIQSD